MLDIKDVSYFSENVFLTNPTMIEHFTFSANAFHAKFGGKNIGGSKVLSMKKVGKARQFPHLTLKGVTYNLDLGE